MTYELGPELDLTPLALTSEQDHAHECPECGGTWLHANDLCEWDRVSRSYITSMMICPECDL